MKRKHKETKKVHSGVLRADHPRDLPLGHGQAALAVATCYVMYTSIYSIVHCIYVYSTLLLHVYVHYIICICTLYIYIYIYYLCICLFMYCMLYMYI